MNVRSNLIQLTKFGLVGIANTLIDFGVFVFLHGRLQVFYALAQLVSYTCGMTNSYFLNKFWTFKSRRCVHVAEVAKFVLVNLAALGIALGLLALFRGKYALGPAESKVLATLGSLSMNFLGNRLWVFRER